MSGFSTFSEILRSDIGFIDSDNLTVLLFRVRHPSGHHKVPRPCGAVST